MKKLVYNMDDFIDLLRDTPTDNVFNPWWQNDLENDDYSNSYEIRQHQLKTYLSERIDKVKILLVGEALGYQGGHFSGIAMTSERMLLGYLSHKGILPEHVFKNMMPCRTSKCEIKKDGFNEPTATVVWQHLLNSGISPYTFLIWNAFPWHPYSDAKGLLSNRTPSEFELSAGLPILLKIIDMFSPQKIIAVGEKASLCLTKAGIEHNKVRHPANGGVTKFKDQISLHLKR